MVIAPQPPEAGFSLAKGETTYINNNEIIEKYTKKLLVLQQKLNENINDHKLEKENMLNGTELSEVSNNKMKAQGDIKSSSSSDSKIKFRDLSGYKKDVVVKKLLKTIDIMNQELSKLICFQLVSEQFLIDLIIQVKKIS